MNKIAHYFFSFILLLYAHSISAHLVNNDVLHIHEGLSLKTSKEFVLFTMPKTGSHLMMPFLQKLSLKKATSIWDTSCPKFYNYDFHSLNQLLDQPDALQAYYLHNPVSTKSFYQTLNKLKIKNSFFTSHTFYTSNMEDFLRKRDVSVFFVIRDPRDWIISLIHHPGKPGIDCFIDPWFASLDVNQQIYYAITGTDWYNSVRSIYSRFLPWQNSRICCAVRFEALLGPQGGGCTQEEHIMELQKIARTLNVKMSNEYLLNVFNSSFGKGETFVTGKVGKWRQYFTEEHKALFKQHCGDILIELGYEKDNNW